MVDKFPEAIADDGQAKEINNMSFAPGEGKVPENIGTSVRRSSGRRSGVAVRAVDCWQRRSGH